MDELAEDTRGVSEAAGVVILVGMTVIATTTVGFYVLVVDSADAGPPDANFSYDYREESSALLITHARGDEFPAGELVIEGPDSEVTWAAVAGSNETRSIGQGDTVQISQGNEYGQPVRQSNSIRIYHANNGTRTQLSEWSGR